MLHRAVCFGLHCLNYTWPGNAGIEIDAGARLVGLNERKVESEDDECVLIVGDPVDLGAAMFGSQCTFAR